MRDGALSAQAKFKFAHGRKTDALSAFEITEKARIIFSVPRALGADSLVIEIYSGDMEYLDSVSAVWTKISGEYDEYVLKINIKRLGVGLYFLKPRVTAFGRTLFGHRSGDGLYFSDNASDDGLIQMTVSDFKFDKPEDIYGGIIYHIFVDRFNRGGRVSAPDTARIVGGDWDMIPEYPEYSGAPLKNNTFYGGTLFGIVKKLDYIASLGTRAIYLSPIFTSVSNHKYDTANYMQVDEMFGGDVALKKLIREAQKRNIKIILDGVFNHTGDDSIYFNRYGRYESVGAFQSKSSPYYDWYDFQNHPYNYTSWWGIEILPRINPDKPKCREFFVGDGGVIDKYSSMGVFGFRLDVADELSDSFIADIKKRLSARGSSVLYGEVWEDASNKIAYDKRKTYYLGSELDGVMNYPVRSGIIDYVLNRRTEALKYALGDVLYNAPKRIRDAQMNLLGTHDTERILTVLGGESQDGKSNSYLARARMTADERRAARARLLRAYTILATIPGIPAIFYGDEAGLEGYHDPFNRMPYPWGREDKKILSHYRRIGEIRNRFSAYRDGEFELITLTPDLLVFKRKKNKDHLITAVNNSDSPITLEFSKCVTAEISSNKARSHILEAGKSEIFSAVGAVRLEVKNNS